LEHFRAGAGGIWILGQVQNQGTVAVVNLIIHLELVNDAEDVVFQGDAWPAHSLLTPGAASPFALLVAVEADQPVHARAGLAHAETTLDLGSHYLDLAIVDGSVNIEGGRVRLQGRVENQGIQWAQDANLVATLFDSQDRISGFVRQSLEGPLAPGDSLIFSLDTTPPGAPVARVTFAVQGRLEDQ